MQRSQETIQTPNLGSRTNQKATGAASFLAEEEKADNTQSILILCVVVILAMVICLGLLLGMWWLPRERERKRRLQVALDAERAPGLFFSEDEGASTNDEGGPKAGEKPPPVSEEQAAAQIASREQQIVEEELGRVLVVDPVTGMMRSVSDPSTVLLVPPGSY
uniref:Uncharacterized protein n=1 Tax=Neospora caninum (strain Liverpool) TaxID=572307 RepID=F0JAW1_NEOCL|nr:hypothetical protein, conserved [Neospora caninum Liverpool]CEL71227.1 TPA: hypothetical protein, conserved [Neospora caninum Liverpool]